MAENASDDLIYYLLVPAAHKNELQSIRHWSNIKFAVDGNAIWLKDLNYVQAHSLEVKSLSKKDIFYPKGAKLFLLNSILPDRNIPSLLWTPIDRALAVKLPSLNHNYFGIHETIEPRLVPDEEEREVTAMITSLEHLGVYIEQAPAIRLESLRWALLDQDKVIVMGKPLLPIMGTVYWQYKEFLIPAGYNFDLFSLMDSLNDAINSKHDVWIVWAVDNSCFFIPKTDVEELSISSFRLSRTSL